MTKTSDVIRQEFLDFFQEKGHQVVPSASLVPADDPTLLFTNAGMNQFKDVFLETGTRPYLRAADTQKCLRVSGKHNDLEEVGIDTYHHTFFEMLGNWSFGDYFKKEAIRYAWELLVDRWGLDPERLYVTVHEGDARLGLAPDEEAAALWVSETGIDRSHVLYCGSKDNFWMMGDTGPSGPCSEVHIDLRDDEERAAIPGRDLVNTDDPRVMEIWNLVFIQYNALADGTLSPLKAKHVDTGMGFERVVAVLQGKQSTYDTDLFAPILQHLADLTPRNEVRGYDAIDIDDPEELERVRVAMRVVADHIRTIAFAIADGVQPGNEGRAYVIRRILRRAVRYGYQTLGFREPFLVQLVEPLCTKMARAFPELERRHDLIVNVTRAEEEGFLRTLEAGIQFFDTLTPYILPLSHADPEVEVATRRALSDDRAALGLLRKAYRDGQSPAHIDRLIDAARRRTLPGEVAFLLHDTYGFPIDLTELMSREQGLSVERSRYEELMREQRDRARKDSDFRHIHAGEQGDWTIVGGLGSVFSGYESTEIADAQIGAVRTAEDEGQVRYEVVLDQTPFYAESGGQVGDTGELIVGGESITVIDTQRLEGTIVHEVDRLPGVLDAPVRAVVDAERRREIRKHHTATHLMHAALRELLGPHVAQKGSLVAPDRLRFDFSHYDRVGPEQLRALERRVNEAIQANITGRIENDVPIEEARQRGAMMLFGEKYGDRVRVVTFDPSYSVELCGGTHVEASGEIGVFRFLHEGSVASGTRRVEALVGSAALAYIDAQMDVLDDVRMQFRTTDRPLDEEVAELVAQAKRLEKEVAALRHAALSGDLDRFMRDADDVDGIHLVTGRYEDLGMDDLRQLGQTLRERMGEATVGVIGSANAGEGKVYLVATVSDDLISQRGLKAGALIGKIARAVGGGGGGRPTLATAGGKNPEKLDAALLSVPDILREEIR